MSIIDPKIISRYDQFDQGISDGNLQTMCETLIEYDEFDHKPRIMSFGDFTNQYVKPQRNNNKLIFKVEKPFDIMYELLLNFDPINKLVFWRVLLAQMYLYHAIRLCYEKKISENKNEGDLESYHKGVDHPTKEFRPIEKYPGVLLSDLDWGIFSSSEIENELQAVKNYLRNNLKLAHLMNADNVNTR